MIARMLLPWILAGWLVACARVPAEPAPAFPPVIGAPAGVETGRPVIRALPVALGPKGEGVAVYVEGSLPTPCHRPTARVDINPITHRATVRVGAESPSAMACAQVLTPYAWLVSVAGARRDERAWRVRIGADLREVPPARVQPVPLAPVHTALVREAATPHLRIEGALPTPCHTLALAYRVDPRARELRVRLGALAGSGACIQKTEPFRLLLPLGPAAGPGWRVRVDGRPVGG